MRPGDTAGAIIRTRRPRLSEELSEGSWAAKRPVEAREAWSY